MNMIEVKKASCDQISWINERYKEVDFVPSEASDYVAIAKMGGKPAGIGRVVGLGDGKSELGGMYVFEEFRGSGVARAIIAHLLDNVTDEILFCVPFGHLEGLYASFGFRRIALSCDVPSKLLEKHRWCNSHYSRPALLMKMEVGERVI